MDRSRRTREQIIAGGAAAALAVTAWAALSVVPAADAAPLGADGMDAAAAKGKLPVYFEFDGITPASPAADHSTDIALTKFAWQVTSDGDPLGTGQGTAKVTVAPFTLTKRLDAATPALLAAVGSGRHGNGTVFIVHLGPNGTPIESLEYDLREAVITGDTEAVPVADETVTVNPRTVKVTYFLGNTAQSSWESPGIKQ